MSLKYINDLKFANSLSTMPYQSRLFASSSVKSVRLSYNHFQNPYKQTKPSKFPKGKRIIKTTQGNLYQETTQNPERSTIRNFRHANHSTVYDAPKSKRLSNPGYFNNLSLESKPVYIINGTFEDIGINNRKKTYHQINTKPDPVIVGQQTPKLMNSTYEKNWKQPRRHRDNGIRVQQTLKWNTKKQKPKTYAEIHSNKCKLNQ